MSAMLPVANTTAGPPSSTAMSSSESSDASRSLSPEITRAEPRTQPGLDRLVEFFVSAKRALGISQHVQEATLLVDQSRVTLEDLAVRSAKNAYVRSKAERQVDILKAIEQNIEASAAEVEEGFRTIITRLDRAHGRLEATIAELKAVIVDSSLQRQHEDLNRDKEAESPSRTLFDYVDEAQYDQLSQELKVFIDSFDASRRGLGERLATLGSRTADVTALLSEDRSCSPSFKQTVYDEPGPSIADAFYTMEDHTHEMGTLLQSLISHYDLCVSALKHTEGGREAARDAVLSSQAANEEMLQESLYNSKAAASLTIEERSEILRVIEGDASEVTDVVNDIKEHAAELEQYHRQLVSRAELASGDSARLVQAAKSLGAIRDILPVYLNSIEDFKSSWESIQASIDAKIEELDGLTSFYGVFIAGYGSLLREVARRKAVETQMQKIAEKAQRDLDKLHESDRVVREEFVQEFGSFLPGDLWPGVTETGVRWHIRAEYPAPAESEESQGPEIG